MNMNRKHVSMDRKHMSMDCKHMSMDKKYVQLDATFGINKICSFCFQTEQQWSRIWPPKKTKLAS